MRLPVFAVCVVLGAASAAAQDTTIVIHPESSGVNILPGQLPRLVAEEVVQFYNAATTSRLVGRTLLPKGNEWRGDVAVRNGPVLVAGRIQGSLLVINGDLLLEPGAEITGTVLVVGGTANGVSNATVHGQAREYREALNYRIEGDAIEYVRNPRRLLPFFGAQKTWATAESRSTLTIATGGTFNRVEGLPIVFGPLFDWRLQPAMRLRIDALGVFRTAGDLTDKRGDLGYMFRAELRKGEVQPLTFGFRAFDVVAPVEDWTLRNSEVGWGAFVFQRDYRDYYLNKGIAGRVAVQLERPLNVAVELRRELQTSVTTRDPFTVFRNDQLWRPNPPVDDGHYTTLDFTVTLDTRNDPFDPTSGWFARATIENSKSKDVSPQTAVPAAVRGPIPTDGSYSFGSAFFDVRRYTRVSPAGRVNLRFLTGGWIGGNPLPLQRRLSLGGPDPLVGYAFRHSACNRDITDPTFAGSAVAACDRVLLVQGEYRGHIALHWAYNPGRSEEPRETTPRSLFSLQGPDLVVFGNAGQGWLVGNGPGHIPPDQLPTIGSWIADLGLGVDWGGFGVYVGKAVTSGEPVRFSLRLDHRF
jgi:hypothetical protein